MSMAATHLSIPFYIMSELINLVLNWRRGREKPSDSLGNGSNSATASTLLVVLNNLIEGQHIQSSDDRYIHKQLIITLSPQSTVNHTAIQPTQLIVKVGESDIRVLEYEDVAEHKRLLVSGLVVSRLCVLACNHSILLQVLIQPAKPMYSVTALLLTSNMWPFRIASSAGRRKLCRNLNHLNSQLTYGAYYTDADTGKLGFRVCLALSRAEFQRLLQSPQRLRTLVESDIEIIRGSFISTLPRILEFAGEASQRSRHNHKWASEILPFLRMCNRFTQLQTNQESLKQQAICSERVGLSQGLVAEDMRLVASSQQTLEEAFEAVNSFFELKLENMTPQERARWYTDIMSSESTAKHYPYLQKARQSRSKANQNLNISCEISLMQKVDDRLWSLFSSTDHSQLRRQKLTFAFTGYPVILNFNQQPQYFSRLLVAKTPANTAWRTSWTPQNSVVKRQAEIVKLLNRSECAHLAKFYRLDDNRKRLAAGSRDRTIHYGDLVLMDYYTYKSLDGFMLTNCQTVSSLTRMSAVCQIAQAIKFMKNVHMAHLDLKSTNILFGKGYLVKVADFGQAYIAVNRNSRIDTQLDAVQMDRHIPGFSLPYSPPEVFRSEIDYDRYGHKIDVYSFGVLLLELLFDRLPIEMRHNETNKAKLVHSLKDGSYPQYVLLNVERLYYYLDRQVAEIVCYIALCCLHPDPLRRPAIEWVIVSLRKLHSYIH